MARQFSCTPNDPVVQTKAGKIRGFRLDGTVIFHGIKYADAERFKMPTPVQPWEGIKDALSYGYVCPLRSIDQPQGEIMVPHRYWPENENCQYLNIWTPEINDHGKRPVIVWLHGGGFSAGSSIEHIAYDGEALSKFGDVVVVSINHRLNVIGYLDLSPYSEEYANSANVGNADIVASLEWIQDNIEAFGGDPDNVTLFGQSGGGMKIYSLMQTPAADGLFHKGWIMSGVADLKQLMGIQTDNDSRPLIDAMMLYLHTTDVKTLETVPYAELAAAYNATYQKIAAEGHYVGEMPIANDWYVGDPFDVGFREEALKIPIVAGTVLSEFLGFAAAFPHRDTMSEEEAAEIVTKAYGDNAPALIEVFKKTYPGKPLVDIVTMDDAFRAATSKFIRMKAEKDLSATYSYLFAFDLPLEDTKSPWHCSDIPYYFHNSAIIPYTNAGPESDRIEEQLSGALVAFARTGNPNHDTLPEWPKCEPGKEPCMILDRKCEVRVNHDDELLKLHHDAPMLWMPMPGQIQH